MRQKLKAAEAAQKAAESEAKYLRDKGGALTKMGSSFGVGADP